ncbi:MAG TPA: tetratricopeptide repeat protein [Phenylobacterium sp.]|nr:tetratricopeptide repeat protein [Phenylobacterium sp.]
MLGQFFSELRRRNVIRVGGIYAVTAWGLFQVAKTVFETLSFPRWASPLALLLLAMGFPIAMIIAWAFERGPEGGIHRTDAAPPGARTRLSWIDGALLAGIALVVGLSAAQVAGFLPSFRGERATVVGAAKPDKSVAVLPFANYSAVRDSEYFADGLTEEVINSLAQIPDLKVAGRTSAFYFKGKNEDLREIGRQLGVAHVVEGSVRREGDNLRVTAQLVSVKDGFHLWSKTYDRKMDDAFAIQTEIANAVADALKTRLQAEAGRPGGGRDPAAYNLQLTARAHLRRWGLADLQAARDQFDQLTSLEPANPSALAGYAQATMLLAQNHMAIDFDEAKRVSEGAVAKALAIDPKSLDAWLAKAYVNRISALRSGEDRYERVAMEAIRTALAIEPRNAEALSTYAVLLGNTGQPAAAVDYAQRSLAVDPLNRVSQMVLAKQLAKLGRLDDAAHQLRAVIQLYPDFDEAKLALGEVLVAQGRLDEAEPWIKSSGGSDGRDTAAAVELAHVYLNLGLPAEADAVLAKVTAPAPGAAIAKVARLGARGDYKGVLEFAEAQQVKDQDPIWTSCILIGAVAIGDIARAHKELTLKAPQLFLPEPPVSIGDLEVPLYAGHVLNVEGDRAQARRILNQLLAVTTVKPGQHMPLDWRIERARAYAELGDGDRAMAELSAAKAEGWRTVFFFEDWVWLDKHPTTRALQGDARFVRLIADVRSDLTRQRQQLLAQRR